MRVLVTVSPRLYRESVASSMRRGRPDLEVRAAPPDEVELELAGFGPHLLVHNDALPAPKEALEGVPCRVELPYSDGMDARVMAGWTESRVRDMSTEDLLRTVAVAATVGGPGVSGRAGRPATPRIVARPTVPGATTANRASEPSRR